MISVCCLLTASNLVLLHTHTHTRTPSAARVCVNLLVAANLGLNAWASSAGSAANGKSSARAQSAAL